MYRKWFSYKYACFQCRKVFARQHAGFFRADTAPDDGRKLPPHMRRILLPQLTATCPQCGGAMYWMGERFKAPPQHKIKAWEEIEVIAKRRYAAMLQKVRENADKIDPYFSGKGD